MEKNRNIRLGIVAILGISCFLLGVSFLKSMSFFSSGDEYYAVFDHSNGLQKGTSVTINGVIVGSVLDLKLQEKTSKIEVKFSVKEDFKFSKNSTVEIFSSLLGSAGLQIIPALDGAEVAKSGDYLKTGIKQGIMDSVQSELKPTARNLNETLASADTLITNLNQRLQYTIDEKSQRDIKESLHNLNQTIKNLNSLTQNLDKTLKVAKIDKTLENLNKISENLSVASAEIKNLKLSGTMDEIEASAKKMNSMLQGIESGKGTLGLLMKDEKLYNNLRTASSEMGLLLEDVRRNPKRYVHISVFGKKQEEYKAPQQVETPIYERENSK